MRKEDCFYLGIIARKHSFKGEVVLVLDTDEPELYENLESVFIALGDNLVPFFIEKSLLQKGNQLRILFEDMNSEEDANNIIGAKVYLPLQLLPKLSEDKFYYHEIIGFKVVDENYGDVGIIIGINDSSAQPLFVIKNNEKEILIPVIDDFISKIDKKNKKLSVDTPPGLIELYLD